jgi:hypothetical protein
MIRESTVNETIGTQHATHVRVFHHNNCRDGMVFGYQPTDTDGTPTTVTEVYRYAHRQDDGEDPVEFAFILFNVGDDVRGQSTSSLGEQFPKPCTAQSRTHNNFEVYRIRSGDEKRRSRAGMVKRRPAHHQRAAPRFHRPHQTCDISGR